MTYTHAMVADVRGTSIGAEWLRFKRRLRWVLKTNLGDSQGEMLEALIRLRAPISQPTLSRWLDEESDSGPDVLQLIAIIKASKGISADWLLGRKKAESVDEQFIESRI